MYRLTYLDSEILTIEKIIATFEHSQSSEAYFVLLSHIAHVEKLLVVEHEQLSLSVEIGAYENWEEGPPDELFEHEHATHACKKSESTGIASSS